MKAALPTLALLILLTGCGATAPENQPKTPTPAAASETTDPLYEEAVAVAKAIDEIDQRYYYQNKYDPFPEEEYSKYAEKGFIDATKALYENAKTKNLTWKDAGTGVIRYREMPGLSKDGSLITLQQCSDGSKTIYEEDGQEKNGIVGETNYFFKKTDGELKIFSSSAVKSGGCEW